MDNPLEMFGDALQGDIEIAGRKIPKIALIGGGVGIIILFVLLGKKGGGSAATPFRQTANETETANTEQAIGETVGGISEDILGTVQGLIEDNNQSLSDLISQNNDSISNSLSEQIQSVYDSIAGSGGYAPSYSDYATPLPIDTFGFAPSTISDYQSYSSPTVNPIDNYSGSNKINSAGKSILENLKPSAVKDKAGTKNRLGSAVISPDKSKINQLVGGKKPILTGSLNFNKKPIVSSNTPLGKQQKQTSIKPSLVSNNKGKQGNVSVTKPISKVISSPKTTSIKPSFLNSTITKITKPFTKPPTVIKPVQTSKPTNISQPKQVSYNPIQYQPKQFIQPVKPVSPIKNQPTFGSAYGKIKGFKK